MSNIYIQEPPTSGKILLKTTAGDIDIELWSKETPLACRNFVQLCLEGYYDNNIFHRLVKGFIVQTGDPSGTGLESESIYGKPYKDEFHSRLRFVRRGLVALANGGSPDDNGSQFFFTLDSTPELQNKHTIFGKVTGKTLYNMLRLGEGEVDRNERPLYPHKILSTDVLSNPFSDIVPRQKKADKRPEKSKMEQVRANVKASKNFTLLSFGHEAEEEEEEITKAASEFKGKSKSSHDLLKDDAKLSSVPAVDKDQLSEDKDDEYYKKKAKESEADRKMRLDKVKAKLNIGGRIKKKIEDVEDIEDIDLFEDEKQEKKKREIEKAKDEFVKLKKEMLNHLKKESEKVEEVKHVENSVVAEFMQETNKFKETKQKIPKKGQGREEMCWDLLQNFKKRLESKREQQVEGEEPSGTSYKDAWLGHKMNCLGEDEIVLARDANIRNEEDWYDIYDPRNPLNKRRRNEKVD